MKEYSNYIILAIDNARGGTLQELIRKSNKENKPLTDD
jgi:calcium-dependent protein kinase